MTSIRSSMICQTSATEDDRRANGGRVVHAAAAIGVVLGALLGGCAKNASSEWAQTAPVIKSELPGVDAVRLGVRPG